MMPKLDEITCKQWQTMTRLPVAIKIIHSLVFWEKQDIEPKNSSQSYNFEASAHLTSKKKLKMY